MGEGLSTTGSISCCTTGSVTVGAGELIIGSTGVVTGSGEFICGSGDRTGSGLTGIVTAVGLRLSASL